MQLPAVGDLFVGKYKIQAILGQGGFATVYRATDVAIARDVALKVLTPGEAAYTSSMTQRFMTEAKVFAGLHDPHTIRLFDFGQSEDGLLYMVFQYVAGTDLETMLLQRGPMPPDVAVHITRQVLQALGEAHAAGVLHRDIKPANILVHEYMGDPYAVKLLDFGIAKVDPAHGGVSLTRTGAVLGTPRFMAPEQLFGEPTGAYTDLYSLGLVAFQMLTGSPALEGDQRDIIKFIAAEHALRVPEYAAGPAVRRVIDRMLHREPTRRFPGAYDVLSALDAALREDAEAAVVPPPMPAWQPPAPASPSASVTRPATQATRRGRVVLAASLGLCAVAGAAVFWLVQQNEAPSGDVDVPDHLLRAAPAPAVVRQPTAPPPSDAGNSGEDQGTEAARLGCGGAPEPRRGHRIPLPAPGRSMHVTLPKGYQPDVAYPLLLGFSPKYMSPEEFSDEAGLDELTNEADVILVTPLPLNETNPWKVVADEIEITRQAVETVAERFCVDQTRIYAVGHYDGAENVRRMMCELTFSGVVLTAFGERVTKEFCEPLRMPTMWVIGKEDPMIPLGGERGCTKGVHPKAAAYDAMWRERNGCSGRPRPWLASDTSTCETWSCDAPYVSCRAEGGHHLRKRNETIVLYPFCGQQVMQFPVADAAWRFFQETGRPIGPLR